MNIRHFKKALCIGLVLCGTCLPAVATPITTNAFQLNYTSVSPRYVALFTFSTDLSIETNGKASCKGTALASDGYTCDVTLKLQKQNGSSWETIKTWTSSSRINALSKSWYVGSGTYRLQLTAEVFNSTGTMVESPSIYSNTVVY